jgi:hypothetical protein
MKPCYLCNKNKADKTGSHMIPHFLMKRVDHDYGETDRGKELGFIVTDKETTSYFGQAILPEKLKDIYNEVNEELIERNKVSGIEDNYFCTACEKKFSILESEYSKSLNKTGGKEQAYESLNKPFIGFLFWASVFWRFSLQSDSGFNLKQKDEKKLNRILAKYLNENNDLIKADENDIDLLSIGYKILRSPNFSRKSPTYLHANPYFQRPYSLMVDEFIVFLYFKKSHLKDVLCDFYGTLELNKNAAFNTPFKNEYIYVINSKTFNSVIDKIIENGIILKIKYLKNILDLFHQNLGGKGKNMSEKLKGKIIDNILTAKGKLGIIDSKENQIEIIIETILEHKKT